MAFLNINIIGDGTAQVAITNSTTLEAVVNSLVANNSTGGALNFSVLIDDAVVFTESVSANNTFRIPDKVNLGVNSVLKVNADTGINVGVSYLQQAIDATAANTAIQQAVADTAANVTLTSADVVSTNANVVATQNNVTTTANNIVTAQSIIDNISVAPLWVSGTDYSAYQIVTDTVDFKTYKAKVDITNSTTEPSSDTNWADISSGGANTFTEIQTAVGGETAITVPTYVVGANQLVVVIEGNVQFLDTDYTETDATTITLTTALTADEKILIQKV